MANDDKERQKSREQEGEDPEERLRTTQFEYRTELTSFAMQGTIYIVLINGAILFGALNVIKDYENKPLVKGIGGELSELIISSIFLIFSYYCFSFSKIFLRPARYEGEIPSLGRGFLKVWFVFFGLGAISSFPALWFFAGSMISIYHRVSML
jgi:hypothetical protein